MAAESHLDRLRRLEREAATQGGVPGSAGGRGTGASPGSRPRSRASNGIIAGAIATLLFLLIKGKFILLLLLTKGKLLLGLLKFKALFTTFSTMGASILVYAQFYGWSLAALFIFLILVHELGHGFAARIMRLEVGAPVFIPFFGALIAIRGQLRSSWVECIVGAGGPIAGTAGGLITLLIGHSLGDGHAGQLCIVAAWLTFTLNLFNLLPVWGLDGDRISRPFQLRHWVIAVGGIIAALLLFRSETSSPASTFALGILIVAGFRLGVAAYRHAKGDAAPRSALEALRQLGTERPAEDSVEAWQRNASTVVYLLLIATLLGLGLLSHSELPPR